MPSLTRNLKSRNASSAPGRKVGGRRWEGSAASRGYDHRWQKARAVHLAGEPLCRRCLAQGLTTAATVVDHIRPHRGDMALFWDQGNWQSLCKPCHDIKTAIEDGGFGGEPRVSWHPEWIEPSAVPLTIVCGPPGAGKSSWVEARADESRGGRGDVVVDLDRVAREVTGHDGHDWPRARLTDVGRERNARLAALSRMDPGGGRRAWYVVSEPEAKWRQWWCRRC